MSKIKVRENIEISEDRLAEFCSKWGITSLELFGSALREDFSQKSDLDFLFSYDKEVKIPGLFDMADMKAELEVICQRKVDLISRRGSESSHNKLRKKAILESARVIYVKPS